MHTKNYVPVDLLKPHSKNEEYFSRPTEEEYQRIKRSIEAEGIRDPLKVTPDYTVVAGHLRLEIAKELGFDRVPVEIVDGDEEYLEYLLVADNEERRVCRDPMKKARRAEFLARYWGVRQGSLAKPGTPEGHFVPQVKTLADVAEAVGESEKGLKRLLKLNDLIPELQALVSTGRLGTTAAEQLAYLTPEVQHELYAVLGETIAELTVREAKDLRARAEGAETLKKELEDTSLRAVVLEEELHEARKELADLKGSLEEYINDVRREAHRQGKEKIADLEEQIEKLKVRVARLVQDKEAAEERARELGAKLGEAKKQIAELASKSPEVVEKVVYRPDPLVEAEKERLSQELEFTRQQFDLTVAAKEKLEDQIRALREERKVLQRKLEETSRPEGPEEKKHDRFLELLDKAGTLAKELGASLEQILRDYSDDVKRIGGSQKEQGLEDAVEVLADTVSFRIFKLSVDYAADRLVDFYQALQEKRPNLVVLKGGKSDAQKAKED